MLELCDISGRKLCYLEDNSLSSANINMINSKNNISNIKSNTINVLSDKKINGIDTISFEIPNDNPKTKLIKNEMLIKYEGEFYKILDINISVSDRSVTKVNCKHLSCILENLLCPEFKLIGQAANELITNVLNRVETILNDDGSVKSKTNYPSGWTVGVIDIPNTQKRSLENSKEQNIFINLTKIAELFEAKLVFHSVTKTIDLISQKLDRQITIRRRKNLKNLELHYGNNERVITRLYAYGKSNESTHQEISIVDANPTRQSYIEDFSWYVSQGYTMEYINQNKGDFLSEVIWRDSNYIESQSLYNEAIKKLSKISKPKVKCTVKGVDLSIFPEEFIQSPQIGEIIYIIDEENNIKIQAEVVNIKRKSRDPLDMEIDVSNEVEYNSILKQIQESVKNNNMNTNGNGTINGDNVVVNGKYLYKKFGDIEVNVQQTSNGILQTVKDTEKGLSTKIEQTEKSINQSVEDKINKTNSNITQTANGIKEEINNKLNNMSTEINKTSEGLKLTIKKGNVIGEINASAEQLLIDIAKVNLKNVVLSWENLPSNVASESQIPSVSGLINTSQAQNIATEITRNYVQTAQIRCDQITSAGANPIIRLFNNASIDATANMETGTGNAIRLKWDKYNYILVSSGSIEFYINGVNVGSVRTDGFYANGVKLGGGGSGGNYYVFA